jgi:hypothetical protein
MLAGRVGTENKDEKLLIRGMIYPTKNTYRPYLLLRGFCSTIRIANQTGERGRVVLWNRSSGERLQTAKACMVPKQKYRGTGVCQRKQRAAFCLERLGPLTVRNAQIAALQSQVPHRTEFNIYMQEGSRVHQPTPARFAHSLTERTQQKAVSFQNFALSTSRPPTPRAHVLGAMIRANR